MFLLFVAFLSGVLTVLSPCVLPLLPIILGGGMYESDSKKWAFILISSLGISLLIFTLLLKVSSSLISIPEYFWQYFSGIIIIALWIIMLFPNLWKYLSEKWWLNKASNRALQNTQKFSGNKKYIFMWIALGPVFSSCSPMYAVILALVLPAWYLFWILALIFYIVWLASILLLISILWQSWVKKLKWASKPSGIFKKIVAFVFIVLWILIISWYDKKIQLLASSHTLFPSFGIEEKFIDDISLNSLKNPENISQWGSCTWWSCTKKVEGSLSFLSPKKILDQNGKYIAPELEWLTNWINSNWYTSLDELKGQVIMIDFWTSGCINCIASHPVTQWLYEEFKDQWFVVLGIHAPEFAYEQKKEVVAEAVKKYNLTFPVALDNDFETWKNFHNLYWPSFYIIDKEGFVRYLYYGQWGDSEKREKIQELLAE